MKEPFEWDAAKSRANKVKHGLDFEEAKAIWKDSDRVEINSSYEGESRFVMIGKIHGKIWTVIFTYRQDIIRLISARRSRKKEMEIYEKN